ncbi:GyrI-like domain-containing protein [Pseudoalteromonas luteoviolacea]|uniref:GyrI-like domain-containing protein n=1 Tax=Pseudoalteromonas luteoviolacea TaxID=43657 RepID=UPI0032B57BD5
MHFTGSIAKEDLIYQLMIRQPKFVTNSLFENVLVATKEKKPSPLLDLIRLESMADEKCIQMLHIGPFEDEQETFEIMDAFANQNGLVRVSKVHREIYLSDVRKVAPEKLKTVLRFKVE